MGLEKTVLFERGQYLYMVAPVTLVDPTEEETATFSFDARKFAPNEKIGWLRGQYVEAERANANGAMWSADDLAIKSITPRLMPVSTMHNFRELVGVIADVRLLTPDADKVPRARIDDTLAIWKHRYPDVWEEVIANSEQGLLMQSQECLPEYHECSDCGLRFPNEAWVRRTGLCSHLGEEAAAEGRKSTRRLGNVTFTGTGLIFGTRGARGAYDDAHLEVLREEVAEHHEKAKHPEKPKPKKTTATRRTRKMEIEDREYQQLLAAQGERDQLKTRVPDLEEQAKRVPDLEKQVEKLEIEKKAAEDSRDEEKSKRETLEEQSRAATLASERLDKLGDGFKAKLPEKVKTKLEEQAKSMSDDEWTGRLEEVAEMVGVKIDAAKEDGELTAEEVARSGAGASGSDSGSDSGSAGKHTGYEAQRRTVVGGILSKL